MKRNYLTTIKESAQAESGVALLFALAILSLLLVLMIGFVSSALLTQRIAYNYGAAANAKLAADTGLNRLILTMQQIDDPVNRWMTLFNLDDSWKYTHDPTEQRILPFVSGGDKSVSYNTDSNIDVLEKPAALLVGAFSDYFLEDSSYSNWFPSGAEAYYPKWVYQYIPDAKANSGERVVGRSAYIVMPNLGINPHQLGSISTYWLDSNPSRPWISYDDAICGMLDSRSPLAQSTLFKYASAPSSTQTTSFKNYNFTGRKLKVASNFFVTNAVNGRDKAALVSKYQYPSLDVVLGQKVLNTDMTPKSNATYIRSEEFLSGQSASREMAALYYTTDDKKSKEQFYCPVCNAWKDRFDLTQDEAFDGTYGDSWDSGVTVGDITKLCYFEHNTKLTDKQKKQIAANLIDYNDSDSLPTSDVSGASNGTQSNWLSDGVLVPAYAGNEKTPYINQIVFSADLKVVHKADITDITTDPAKPKYAISETFSGDVADSLVAVELIQIYGDAPAQTVRTALKDVEIKGEMSFSGGGTLAPIHFTIKTDSNALLLNQIPFTCDSVGYRANGAILPNVSSGETRARSYENGTASTISTNVTWKITSIKVGKVVLMNDNRDGIDITGELDWGGTITSDAVTKTVPTLSGTGSRVDSYNDKGEDMHLVRILDFEVKDPRCNLDFTQDFWTLDKQNDIKDGDSTWGDKISMDFVGNNITGRKNNNAAFANDKLDVAKDIEVSDDPGVSPFSTATIPNRTMEYAWELGMIHRGAPYQTLNLKTYTYREDGKYDYLDGDAALLDQIKMSKATEDYKFNINLPAVHENAFRALTYNLKYHTPNGSLATFDGDMRTSLAKWLAYKAYDSSSATNAPVDSKRYARYNSRGELAAVIQDWLQYSSKSPYNGTTMARYDVLREELVGKLANLATLGEPYEYYTVFVVGQTIRDTGDQGVELVRYDDKGEKVEATCELGAYEPGFDEITGTSIIVARLRRDLDCAHKDGCRYGEHSDDCKFKVTVLEKFSIDE